MAINACKGGNNNNKDSTADTANMPADETSSGKASAAPNASQQKENAAETKVPSAQKNDAPEKAKFTETTNALTQFTDTTSEEGTHLRHETNEEKPIAFSHQTADIETKAPSTEKTDEGRKTSSAQAIDENMTVSLLDTANIDTRVDTANAISTFLETTKTETRVSPIESNTVETTNTENTGLFNETTDAGEKAQLVESDNKDSVSHSKDVTAAIETTSPHKAAESKATAAFHDTTDIKN
ncbi:hypothetical protein Aperf_G00000123852 [Anoplocephala perfoliata]